MARRGAARRNHPGGDARELRAIFVRTSDACGGGGIRRDLGGGEVVVRPSGEEEVVLRRRGCSGFLQELDATTPRIEFPRRRNCFGAGRGSRGAPIARLSLQRRFLGTTHSAGAGFGRGAMVAFFVKLQGRVLSLLAVVRLRSPTWRLMTRRRLTLVSLCHPKRGVAASLPPTRRPPDAGSHRGNAAATTRADQHDDSSHKAPPLDPFRAGLPNVAQEGPAWKTQAY